MRTEIPYEEQLLRQIETRLRKVDQIFNRASQDLTRSLWNYRQSHQMPQQTWYWERNRALKQQVDAILKETQKRITDVIQEGSKKSWDIANQKNNALVNHFGRGLSIPRELYTAMHNLNLGALDTFLSRSIGGMNLSKRVWSYMGLSKDSLEAYLGSGIVQGRSAAQLSLDVRDALKYPDKLFRRVRDEDGNLVLSKAAQQFHPGRGVYRSSYQNALRLTQTETNMAYRTADFERRQQLPMVLGIEVKLSASHPVYDMCDDLKGEYPKGFLFTGWHPKCICYSTSKMMTKEEFKQYLRTGQFPEVKYVDRIPKNAAEWVKKNQERIERSSSKPYWIKDNFNTSYDAKEVIGQTPTVEVAGETVAPTVTDMQRFEQRVAENKKGEVGGLFDTNGNKIFEQKGSESKIVFTSDQVKLMKGNVMVHNHPWNGCASFSYTDYETFIHTGLSETRVIASGNRGVFSMRNTQEFESLLDKLHHLESVEADYKREFKRIMKLRDKEANLLIAGGKTISQAAEMVYGPGKMDMIDEVWSIIAPKYGIAYRKIL